MARCICIADHDLDGKRVRCLSIVPGTGRKCDNCKAAPQRTPRASQYRDVAGMSATVR